jgi:DUF4097 and DUF4098 domain-containing protein YvlB
MRFREVLLVIVLLLAGVVIYQAQTGKWDLHFGWEDGVFGAGNEYGFEESRTIEAPLPATLEITNSHGWVEVRGGDAEAVQLTFKKRVWRKDEAEAKEIADKLHYKLDRTADRLSLSTNRDEFTKRNFETGFVLTVPRRMTVRVTNSYGTVKVEAVKEADVRNRHGEVSASEIDGPCRLESSYEAIEARNLGAGCEVVNKHADVSLSKVAGDVRVEAPYSAVRIEDAGGKAEVTGGHTAVEIRRVQGDVSVESSYEDISLSGTGGARVRARHAPVEASDVRGDLDVQTTYEPVTARNVAGSFWVFGHNVRVTADGVGGREITVTTTYEGVDLSGFSAALKVSVRHGNITLRPNALGSPMDVRGEYSAIDFFWPAGGTAPLEAQSRGGNVSWGLPGKPSLEKSNGTSVVKAFVENAGRPGVTLSTTYGDIRIEEKSGKI